MKFERSMIRKLSLFAAFATKYPCTSCANSQKRQLNPDVLLLAVCLAYTLCSCTATWLVLPAMQCRHVTTVSVTCT